MVLQRTSWHTVFAYFWNHFLRIIFKKWDFEIESIKFFKCLICRQNALQEGYTNLLSHPQLLKSSWNCWRDSSSQLDHWFVGDIDFNFVLKIFLYLEGRSRDRTFVVSVHGRKWLRGSGEQLWETTGIMTKHQIHSETDVQILFFSVVLSLLLFHIKCEYSLISKLYYAN